MAHVFADRLGQVKLADGDVPVHLISHGASERYAWNRNGDGFKAATCRNCCKTFEKFARAFRNHANQDPKESYGFPKLAAFNEHMHRVELLTILNGTKAAAERNGGHVADKELEKLAKDGDLPVSMACRVAYDCCSYCQKQARTRDEYCTEDTCGAGGCKHNLAKVVKVGNDVHHLGVDNPNPVWFDISHVYHSRPADRTAYGHQADYLMKAAADGGQFGEYAAKVASLIRPPIGVVLYQAAPGPFMTEELATLVKLACGMASLEENEAMTLSDETARAFLPGVQPSILKTSLGPALTVARFDGATKVAAVLGALADRKVVLGLRDFAELTKRADDLVLAGPLLSGALRRMVEDETLEGRLAKCAWISDAPVTTQVRDTIAYLAPAYALEKQAVARRASASVIRNLAPPPRVSPYSEKQAACRGPAEELARDYACYKVAALARIADHDDEFLLTARFAALQNRVW